MQVTVAIDSFKGCMDTYTAGNAVKEGILKVYPDAKVNICPIADGGEGTVSAIMHETGGEITEVMVHNPVGKLIKAGYGIIPGTKTAVIEMASAAGITLIEESEKNPLHTTTLGVGEMIRDAIIKG